MFKSFINALLGLVAVLVAYGVQAAPETYGFDKAHSKILFSVSHFGISNFYGQFTKFDGSVVFDDKDASKSSVQVTIDADSIDTRVAALDKHLKSPDFFDAAKHPSITFKSTKVVQSAPSQYVVHGELSMHGKSRPLTLYARLNFNGDHPLGPYVEVYKGAHYAGFSALASLLRTDYEIALYAPNIADEVKLIIEVELRRK